VIVTIISAVATVLQTAIYFLGHTSKH
jgi:hypothetical protein